MSMSILTVAALFKRLDEALPGTVGSLPLLPQLGPEVVVRHGVGIQARLVVYHRLHTVSHPESVNTVLNVHRNHKAYYGRGEMGVVVGVGMEVGVEGDYIPIATPSPPE